MAKQPEKIGETDEGVPVIEAPAVVVAPGAGKAGTPFNISGWTPVIVAVIVGLPPSIIAAATFYQAVQTKNKTDETHLLVNSGLKDLLANIKKQQETAAAVAVETAKKVADREEESRKQRTDDLNRGEKR